jgi:hypothetical protein
MLASTEEAREMATAAAFDAVMATTLTTMAGQ